jgi:predicted AlkP superfamily phosphohydrolase/phosphomutase
MRQVLVLVLDAASPDLIEKWTEDGTLPNLKRLRESGAYGRLDSVAEWLAEATPYAFFSGQGPAATGLHCHAMWQKETMVARAPAKDWLPYDPFWRAFGSRGPRAIVVDPPNVYPPEPFNGLEVIGWATHDTLAPFKTYPPELAARIHNRFGSALMSDEMYGLVSKQQFLEDRRNMLEISGKFRQLCLELMQQERWDLFLATLFTGHHAGHRLWSAVNVKDKLTEAERADLDDSVRQVYVSMDEVVGGLVGAVDDDTLVMALSLHGMAANNSRSWIFPEMLQRVLGGAPSSPGVLERLRTRVPVEWRHALKSRLPFEARRGLTRYWRMRAHKWKSTRAFNLFSDTQGWVRINLKGREALGVVEPGEAYEQLCQQISEGLKTFADADTGEPIVKDIFRPHQVLEGPRLAELPDMVVRWVESPASMHRAVRSPKYGEIPWPTPGHNPEGRSGNHRSQGMLIAAGAGIKSGTIKDAHILDLAPTILTLLDQPVPAEMEGKPIKLVR